MGIEELTMPNIREKQPDQNRIVATLALEFHVPIAEMARLYEHERAELAVGAHVTKFLDIFTTRHVQETLRQRGFEKPVVPQ